MEALLSKNELAGRRVPAVAWIGPAAAMATGVAVFIAVRPSPNAGARTRPPTLEKPGAVAAAADAPQQSARAGLNVCTMRHRPWFAPLRGDPRLPALLNDPNNDAPLF